MTTLIIVAQHAYCSTDHMLRYELGVKPLNSIWLHYYHLKKYLIDKKKKFYPININNNMFDIKKIPPSKEVKLCICIFNDPDGFKKNESIDNLDVFKKIKSSLKCRCVLITETVFDDSFYFKIEGIFDMIYTNRTCNYKKVVSLGFAANPTFLYPQKNKNIIRILVDHPAYNKKHFARTDRTRFIIDSIFDHKFPRDILVRRFINGDIETLVDKNCKIDIYNRKGINILSAYAEYNYADIFFVTHPESMGLSVIECAMSGTLVVTPKGYINSEFLVGLNYVEFENKIDWDVIMKKLNPKTSRKVAMRKSWNVFYDKICNRPPEVV
jgi:hypothetical protein